MLTEKNVKIQWSDDCGKFFTKLKSRLNTTHILTQLEGSDSYVMYCNAQNRPKLCVDVAR